MDNKITLRAARVNVGLTISEASKLLGVSYQTLYNWENGKSYPQVDILPKIEELYRIKYDNLKF